MADMTTMEQAQQVMGALGYPTLSMPQGIKKVTNTKTTTQGVQYDPNKWQALMTALGRPTVRKSKWESLANALATTPEARSFTGAYGTEVINPWAMGLSSLARGFGSAYGDRLASAREAEMKDQENALKAAQLDAEATKQAVAREIATEHMKYNDPNAKTEEQLKQEMIQEDAALDALRTLDELAKSGDIRSGNKQTSDWWLTSESSRNIGRRDQALSALIPLTNKVARASGASGINTLGEMLAYVGLPENATSAQIEGALPGMIKKLGMAEKFYQMSPANNTNAQNQPVVIGGYQIIPE